MRLRVRPRSEGPVNDSFRPSLFARLAPSVVVDLASKTSTNLPIAAIDNTFLPLSVCFGESVIYVSYNGGELEEEENSILDLPSCLIPRGLPSDAVVEISVLSSIQDAESIHVEPLTFEDWELLEAKAQFLESALLQQVTVVYSEQILPLWVGKRDFAWIRVLPDNFQTHAWPKIEGNASTCIRLVNKTKVLVRPKVRDEQAKESNLYLRVYPTREDYSLATNGLAEYLGRKQISTSPGTVILSPSTKQKLLGVNVDDSAALAVVWKGTTESSSNDENLLQSCVLQVAFSDLVPTEFIAIHFLTRSNLEVSALDDCVCIRILTHAEVARGSVGLIRAEESFCVSLQKIELQEVRTERKWRYPIDGNFQGILERFLSDKGGICQEASTELGDEPIQVDSFLLGIDKAGFSHAVYRALQNETVPQVKGDCRSHKKPSDFKGCFVRRHSLPAFENSVSLPATYMLRLGPQLLNLLPETSRVPASLKAQPSVMVVGDAIVCGESGKTHTALVLAAVARFLNDSSTYYLDCKQLKEGRKILMKDILSELKRVFRDATSHAGEALIILDDLDQLIPNLEANSAGDDSTQLQQINPLAADQAYLIGGLLCKYLDRKRPTVIITCKEEGSLLPCVTNARMFTRKIASPSLTSSDREQILWNMISRQPENWDQDVEYVFRSFRIGRKTDGFQPRDLLLISKKVRHMMQNSADNCLPAKISSYIIKALEGFMPLGKLSLSEGGSIDWNQMGGLWRPKKELKATIASPAKYRRIYEKAQIRLPRGVLLLGFPGSGKSLAVQALAKHCSFSLINVRGPELLDRYIGASEAKVRELFARAAASTPAIIFFDEIDALAPRRGSDRTGVTDRVVNQLLTLLDGVEDVKSKGVIYIVGATSRPDIVDPALIRPGRLEKHVFFGPPETDAEYTDLIISVSSQYSVSDELKEFVSSGAFVREAKAAAKDHFHRMCCADFKAIFDTAQLSAIHELLQKRATDENVEIQVRHVTAAMRSTKPTLVQEDYNRLIRTYRPFLKSSSQCENGGGASDNPSAGPFPGLRTALR